MNVQGPPPTASVTPLPARPQAPATHAPRLQPFGRVYDLAEERERRTVPHEALAAVAEAARVYEQLDAAGMSVRFRMLPGEGVGAELRDRSGAGRPLTLRQVVEPASLLMPTDAA